VLNLTDIQAELCRERDDMLVRAQTPIELAKGDEADMATMSQDKEQAIWLANDAKSRLAAIEKALARIEAGTYGACMQCGGAIPEERLTAIPLTMYCVGCQSRQERPRKK
jgi:DnaK suppressor protein